MQVETFECAETAAEPIEASEEALRLVEELGLSGQREFAAKTKEGFPARCPYRLIFDDERSVYMTLCPSVHELEKYSNSPIPLRVLQIAAHAKETLGGACEYGQHIKLMVWDRETAAEKDPVLVAYVADNDHSWNVRKVFILARWGEVLESFPVLMKRAADACREKMAATAKRALAELSSASDSEALSASVSFNIGGRWSS